MIISRVETEAEAIIGLVKLFRYNMKYQTHRNIDTYTSLQNNVLREIFNCSIYPSVKNKKDISYLLNLSIDSINWWFKKVRSYKDTSNIAIKKISTFNILNIYLKESVRLKY